MGQNGMQRVHPPTVNDRGVGGDVAAALAEGRRAAREDEVKNHAHGPYIRRGGQRSVRQHGVETLRPIMPPSKMTFWALSPASDHVLLGALAAFWALSAASKHVRFGYFGGILG